MDQRITKNRKYFYRRFLIENMLTEDCDVLKIKLGVLRPLECVKKLWGKVTPETMKRCLEKSCFIKKEENSENDNGIGGI